MGIFALSTLLVAGAGVYILSKVFPNFQPGEKKVQADLQEMRAEVEPEAADLVPLQSKDIELLASQEEDRTVKKGMLTHIKGKLATIFHEPVVIYRYKKYISTSGKDAVLYARTSQHEYFLWVRPKGVKLVIDNKLVGMLENGSDLVTGKGRLIARIDRQAEEYMPVLVEGREVGTLLKDRSQVSKQLTTRAFGYVKDDISREERALLVALTIYELILLQLDQADR